MGWILRIFFLIAAPIAAWLVARDAANFEVVQGFVVILLITGVLLLAALWSNHRRTERRS